MTQFRFSIVIPTFNRPTQLTTCLQAIQQLKYPRDRFEVIVVNDGGTALETIVAPFQQGFNLSLIDQVNAGPATARNTGAASAQGEFLVFTDDDCALRPNYLSVLEPYVLEMPECLVGGYTLNALPHNLFSTASQRLIDYLYDYYNRDCHRASFFASNNFAMSRDRFRSLGGFNTRFPLAAAEDREFCDRWIHQGYPMIYAPEVQIYHAHELTLRKFWRQHFNYGRGAFCFRQMRSHNAQTQIKVEPLKFYLNLLSYPLHQSSSQPALLLSLLLLVSQVANITGFFWERFQHRDRSLTLQGVE